MTTTINIEDHLREKLRLAKRVLGKENYTELIEYYMDARGHDDKWCEYMSKVLEGET